ncbi:MAG: LolA family protein [Flammeovirgaceae bacterium]
MKANNWKYFVMICLMCCIQQLSAQDLLKDMKAMYAAYDQIDNLYAQMVTKEYEGKAKPITERVTLRLQGRKSMYEMGDMIIMRNEEYLVSINKGTKQMICASQRQEAGMEDLLQGISPNLENMVENYEKVTFLGLNEGKKRYRIEKEGAEVAKVELELDATSYLLSKITYFYTDADYGDRRVEISFPIFKVDVEHQSTLFHTAHYLKKRGDELMVSDAYQGYHLIVTR